MSEPNQKLPPEVVEFLDRVESVPLEECRASWELFQGSSPGYQFDDLHAIAATGKKAGVTHGTRSIIEFMWHKNGPPQGWKGWFEHFIKTIEFVVREEISRPT